MHSNLQSRSFFSCPRLSRSARVFFLVFAGFLLSIVGLEAIAHAAMRVESPFYSKCLTLIKLDIWAASLCGLLFIAQAFLIDIPWLGIPRAWRLFAHAPVAFKVNLCASLAMLIIIGYLSTGTLSPYANTLGHPPEYPIIDPKCRYLYNGDYHHFSALFFLLDGKPKQRWKHSVVQRRILYNCIAYPFMKIFEHDLGGLITNALITVLAFVMFSLFALRTVGQAGAIAGMWLLAPFPGIHYYVGQPFLYSMIVPGLLWLFMMVWKLNQDPSAKNIMLVSLGVGLLCTGYDFMPIVAPIVMAILFIKKKWAFMPLSAACILVLSAMWFIVLHHVLHGSIQSENSDIYKNILLSIIHPAPLAQWVEVMKQFPLILVTNVFYCCFAFLPCLFLVALLLYRKPLLFIEAGTIAMMLFILFMNNCLPHRNFPWNMAGTYIARLYEPMFVALLFYVMRAIQALWLQNPKSIKTGLLLAAVVATILGNALVSLGPALNDPCRISSSIYWHFNKHSPPTSMKKNLEQFGRRPWGFCN